jgi:hypothetical protein
LPPLVMRAGSEAQLWKLFQAETRIFREVSQCDHPLEDRANCFALPLERRHERAGEERTRG